MKKEHNFLTLKLKQESRQKSANAMSQKWFLFALHSRVNIKLSFGILCQKVFWRLSTGDICQGNWFCYLVIRKQYCHNYLARKGYAEAVIFSLVASGSSRCQGPHTGFCVTANLTFPSSWKEPRSKTAASQVCPGPVGGRVFGRKKKFSPFQLHGTFYKLFIELSR